MSRIQFNPALVGVDVVSAYLPEHSSPEDGQYSFAYTITISNASDLPVQLLSRHWIITDADNDVQEVRGEGVVGEQPVLTPGDAFKYTSGTPLATPSGMMMGAYEMETQDGNYFDVAVPAFSLDSPHERVNLN